jgi:RNA polymerase-associated protein RTF1
VPTKAELVRKIDDINGLIHRTWTDIELSEKLKRQNALHVKYSGVEREYLTKQLEMALSRGEEEAAARLQEKLDTLEVPRLAFRTSMNATKKKQESRGQSQQEKLALLNAENRRRNAESVRKAQLLERARKNEDMINNKSGQAAGSGASTPDVANENGSGNGTPKQKALLPHIAKLQEQQRTQAKPGLPVIHKPLMDDDIIGALDLDLDIEID